MIPPAPEVGQAASLALLIAVMSAVTMGSRLLGMLAVRSRPAGPLKRALHYLPLGLFAALVVTGMPAPTAGGMLPFAAGLAATAWTAWRGRPLVVSLLVGFAVAWLAELALPRSP